MSSPAPLTWTYTDRWTGHCPVLNTEFVIFTAKGGMFWAAWPDAPEGRTEDLDALKEAALAHAKNMRIVALLGPMHEPADVVWMTASADPLRMNEISDDHIPDIFAYVTWARGTLRYLSEQNTQDQTWKHVDRIHAAFHNEMVRRGITAPAV